MTIGSKVGRNLRSIADTHNDHFTQLYEGLSLRDMFTLFHVFSTNRKWLRHNISMFESNSISGYRATYSKYLTENQMPSASKVGRKRNPEAAISRSDYPHALTDNYI